MEEPFRHTLVRGRRRGQVCFIPLLQRGVRRAQSARAGAGAFNRQRKRKQSRQLFLQLPRTRKPPHRGICNKL